MKSKLNIIQFRNRIKDNTKAGSPKIKLSVFGFFSMLGGNSKPFYGIIDDSTFRLTMNSTFFPTFYILKGKYKKLNNELNVNYTIEPSSKLQLIWFKYFPFVSLLAFNVLFLLVLKNTPIEIDITFNLFIVFTTLFSRWDMKRKKKNLEKKFIEILEII